MRTQDEKRRITCFTKLLFLTEGIILLAAGIHDITAYNSICMDDLQCTRLVNVTWLMIGLASLHTIFAINVFFYSCTSDVYRPFICSILWSMCILSLVVYHTKQVRNIEQVVSTHVMITLAIVTTYCILVVAEIFLHVKLVCLHKRDHLLTNKRDKSENVLSVLK